MLNKTPKFVKNLPVHPKMKEMVDNAIVRLNANSYTDHNDRVRDYGIVRDACSLANLESGYGSTKSLVGGVPSGSSSVGYNPAGSSLRKLMPSDFNRHSFLSSVYWAATKSRWELWTENYRDDYTLVASSSVPKKTIKLIAGVLEDLNIRYHRNKARDTVLSLGNACYVNQKNNLGGLLSLNPLLMALVDPIYDKTGTILLGWRYRIGGKALELPVEDVDHIMTYNMRSNVLGQPAMASMEADVEAAIYAAIYNVNVMRNGGLLSTVFRLRELSPTDNNYGGETTNPITLAAELTKWFREFNGVNRAGQHAFLPFVEGVDILNKVSEMDSAWSNLDDRTAIKVCGAYGVFPERLGIMRTSQYVNKQQVDDTMSLSMDNSNYYATNLADEYFTRVIIKEGLGIDNVEIRATGDFSAVTKTAAEVGNIIANLGVDCMPVDEFRVRIMHLSPLGGELGDKFLGEVIREALLAKTQTAESSLTKAVGPVKHLLSDYKFAMSEKVIHRRSEVRFY
jgi:hypothetical protein